MKFRGKSLVLLPLSLMMLASCGGPEGDNPINDENAIIKNQVSIELKTTAGKQNLAVINRYVESFKEVEPNVNITVTQYSGDYSSLAQNIIDGFAVGNYPDLAMVYPDAVADFINYAKCYNLDSYINNATYGWSEEELADIVPAFLEEGKEYIIPGTYSLPFSKSTEVVYYNKDVILREWPGINNGNPITENYLNNLTWEEFWGELCPAIMAYVAEHPEEGILDTTQPDYAIMGYDSDANFFITLAEQYGYDYTSVDQNTGKGSADFVNDGMKGLIKDLSTYANKHYILTQKSTGKRANDYFKTNQVLFSVGSTAGATYQVDTANPIDMGIMKLPHAEGKEEKVILQGPSMAFLSHQKNDGSIDTDRQLASWLFYKHMITGKTENGYNAAEWSFQTNYLPVLRSIYESDDYKEIYDESQYPENSTYEIACCRIAELATELNDSYFTSPAFPGSNSCRDEVDTLLGTAVKEGTSGGTLSDSRINELFNTAFTNASKDIK